MTRPTQRVSIKAVSTQKTLHPAPARCGSKIFSENRYGWSLARNSRALSGGAASAAGDDVEDLHAARQLDQEFRIAIEVMDASGVAAGKARHRLHALPIRYRDELAFGLAVLAKQLHAESLFLERLDAGFVQIGRVLVGSFARGAAAPNAGDPRLRSAPS